jgi:hypothetical protein
MRCAVLFAAHFVVSTHHGQLSASDAAAACRAAIRLDGRLPYPVTTPNLQPTTAQ